MPVDRLRILVSVLVVVSAALFAVGVAIERNDHHSGQASATLLAQETGGEAGHSETGGEAGHSETGGEAGHQETGNESASHRAAEKKNGERVFGIDTESTALVVAAVAVSLLLVAALWIAQGNVLLPLVVAGFAIVAAVFDVREMFHQIDESRTNLIVIAAVVAVLHLAAAAGALWLARGIRATRT